MDEALIKRIENLEAVVKSHGINIDQLHDLHTDHAKRFDTIQTSLWKRILFRIDGWPGQKNLNASAPAWRPWRKWWTS